MSQPRIAPWHRVSANLYTSTANSGEAITLAKCGRDWHLLLNGTEVAHLGRRASFDHAEGILLNLLNKN